MKERGWSWLVGEVKVKRGSVIGAAGFHKLLMIGPPGVGKSMVAGRIPGILLPLTLKESLEVTGIFSVAGLLPPGQALIDHANAMLHTADYQRFRHKNN